MTKPSNPERRKALATMLTGGAALAGGAALISREEKILAAKLAEDAKKIDVKMSKSMLSPVLPERIPTRQSSPI